MPKTEHEIAIKAHLEKGRVSRAAKSFAGKLAAGTASANYWVTFLLTVILPMLPSLLKQAAPKILSSPKLLVVLRSTRDVINGILEE